MLSEYAKMWVGVSSGCEWVGVGVSGREWLGVGVLYQEVVTPKSQGKA